jgi:hypothetical protein
MITELAQVAKAIPAYCSSGHGVLTPAQWKTCWDGGWKQPTTTAANAGTFAGHNVAPVLIVLLIVALIAFAASRNRSRTTATSN